MRNGDVPCPIPLQNKNSKKPFNENGDVFLVNILNIQFTRIHMSSDYLTWSHPISLDRSLDPFLKGSLHLSSPQMLEEPWENFIVLCRYVGLLLVSQRAHGHVGPYFFGAQEHPEPPMATQCRQNPSPQWAPGAMT